MVMTVGRNDPCPCGSGKKYKKCCEQKQQVVSIHHLLKNEVLELHREIYEFAISNYGDEISEDFELIENDLILEESSDEEFFRFVHTFWFILFGEIDDEGNSILQDFIASHSRKIKRPKLQQILASWQNAKAVVGKVTSLADEEFEVEDLHSKETYSCVVINDQRPKDEGAYLYGLILPYEQQYMFYPSPFQVPDGVNDFEGFIDQSFADSGYDDFQEYLTDSFIEVMNYAPYSDGMVDTNQIEWGNPVYKQVAESFQQEMESCSQPTTHIDIGLLLWYQFCEKRQKQIKKPGIYAAALQYMVADMFSAAYTSQAELGRRYEVGANSISKAVLELEEVLADEIEKMLMEAYDLPQEMEPPLFENARMSMEKEMQEIVAKMQEQQFDTIEEANRYLDQMLKEQHTVSRIKSKSKQDTAQDLIYEAFEAREQKRYELAKKALELNPNHADAYNLLAEVAESPQAATHLFKKGMEAGEKELGKKFFKENSGYFWGLIETRPFMRAKFNYAGAMHEEGYLAEAIKQYQELLTLNPNDSQGVRYSLFVAYLEQKDLKKAKQLLKKYPEETAQGAYNELLIELLEKGFTAKAAMLKNKAIKENDHVIGYLTGKSKKPKHIPDSYSWGDKNEAIVYVHQHGHLWASIMGIKEWLAK